ncbi:MAG: hypothetical protein HY652_01670 [Acidobacteria bacterium]|nr:hypothetical protein [Acidobacteriota bacterium]
MAALRFRPGANRNRVARALQISERNLYRKIRAYQL